MINYRKLTRPLSTAWRPNHTPVISSKAETDAPVIGADEWVAQVDRRRRRRTGLWGNIASFGELVPPKVYYGLIIGLALALPVLLGNDLVLEVLGLSDNGFLLRTAVRFFTFAILAVGLTVVVGYVGLLDLGYIAFMGIAGYLYAYMSSDFVRLEPLIPYGLALPAVVSIPMIVLTVAAIGYCIGAVSLRLAGDYLAIVTLGFGQVFLQLALTMTRVRIPGRERPVDFTQGINGINHLDNIHVFGYEIDSTLEYYYLFGALLVLVYIVALRLGRSRIGRAWRAIREDELAAQVMGIPTRRLKLLAFAIGAGIAALAGSLDATFQGNVVPNPRYSVLTLINLYAMVVLGGIGSLPGAVIGAFVFTLLPELLRSIVVAGCLFYGALLFTLLATTRPWRRLFWLVGITLLGGYLFKFVVNTLAPGLDAGYPPAGSVLNQVVQGWLVIPVDYLLFGKVALIAAILLLLGAVWLRQRPLGQTVVTGVTLYVAAFAWETTLATNPAATRVLVVGLTLVLLMIVRPQGLLGKAEAQIT